MSTENTLSCQPNWPTLPRYPTPPPTRIVVFRLVIPYYILYFWPTFRYHEIQFSITYDMTNEELRSEVCRGFNKDRKSKIRVFKEKPFPKDRQDIIHVSQYMTEITDVSEYLDNEVYRIEFL